MIDFFAVIEAIRRYKTEHKMKLSEAINILTISASDEQIRHLETIQDDIRGVARAESLRFER